MAEKGDPGSDADLARLEARINALKAEREPNRVHMLADHSSSSVAWRMVTELVAGLLVGFGMGYGLDLLFGTDPWLMIVFLFLGLAAGIKALIATARELEEKQAQAAESEGKDG